ncbi:MAG: Sjogren's syndrome/scleroderma autoantigen 1 family protein [Methanosarcina sp.]
MDSEKDQKVKRIARFLELGGTMLAEHCKVCGAPKFRYQGTVICPVCDVREEEDAPEPAAEVQVPEPEPSEEKTREPAEKENSLREKPSAEKEKPLFENKKRFQTHRQKPRFGPRTLDAVDEEEKNLEVTEKGPSRDSYGTKDSRETSFETRIVPQEEFESPVQKFNLSQVYENKNYEDKEALETLLFKKITVIAASILDEKDPRRISEAFKLIEDGLGIIERLKQI